MAFLVDLDLSLGLSPEAWAQWSRSAVAFATTFALVVVAEIGDKSQLVCMTLAARHRGMPILLGAVAAFALLNLAAVAFGAVLAHWLPEVWVSAVVVVLFTIFGFHALLAKVDDEAAPSGLKKSGHGVFFSTFLLIFMAEFGDKTQLAVAGLGTEFSPAPVWLGSTAALALTSLLGVWVGRRLLTRFPMQWVHRASGCLFLVFAAFVVWHALPDDSVEIVASYWTRLLLLFR